MLTIALPTETERRLESEALRLKVNAQDYARKLIEDGLARSAAAPAASDALSRWEALNRTDDPDEIARRQAEFEDFKAAMSRNRLEMEGPGARAVFP